MRCFHSIWFLKLFLNILLPIVYNVLRNIGITILYNKILALLFSRTRNPPPSVYFHIDLNCYSVMAVS